LIISTLFLGGWELPNFLNVILLKQSTSLTPVYNEVSDILASVEYEALVSAWNWYYHVIFECYPNVTETTIELDTKLSAYKMRLFLKNFDWADPILDKYLDLEYYAIGYTIKAYYWCYYKIYINLCLLGVFLYYFFIY